MADAAVETTRRPPAALFAYLAARLHGVPARKHSAYFAETVGVRISAQQAERAARPVRASSPHKGQRGRPGPRRPKQSPAIEEWLLVDERRLGLEKVLVRLIGEGRHDEDLLRQLRRLPGVRQVVETSYQRDVFAILVFRDGEEGEALRAQLEEITDRAVVWDPILLETQEPARATWVELTRRAAQDEDRI
jgi:hypothetical protein